MKLDLSSLEKAIARLEKSLGFLHSELAEDEDLREQFRSATIQAFEFTYELAYNLIKKQLKSVVANPSEIDKVKYSNFVRLAADAGIIRDVTAYIDYRQARNNTSHRYNDKEAEQTAMIAQEFLIDARILVEDLEKLQV